MNPDNFAWPIFAGVAVLALLVASGLALWLAWRALRQVLEALAAANRQILALTSSLSKDPQAFQFAVHQEAAEVQRAATEANGRAATAQAEATARARHVRPAGG